MKKSNVFAYVELQKMVHNLEKPGSSLKESIVNQAAYFHILDPKFFSEVLAPQWESIRERMGYSDTQAGQGSQFMKNTLQARMQLLSEDECGEIKERIKGILEEMIAELGE